MRGDRQGEGHDRPIPSEERPEESGVRGLHPSPSPGDRTESTPALSVTLALGFQEEIPNVTENMTRVSPTPVLCRPSRDTLRPPPRGSGSTSRRLRDPSVLHSSHRDPTAHAATCTFERCPDRALPASSVARAPPLAVSLPPPQHGPCPTEEASVSPQLKTVPGPPPPPHFYEKRTICPLLCSPISPSTCASLTYWGPLAPAPGIPARPPQGLGTSSPRPPRTPRPAPSLPRALPQHPRCVGPPDHQGK